VGLGLRRDLARGVLQRLADLLLLVERLLAGLLPFVAQRCGHRLQRLGPCRQPLVVAGSRCGLQLDMGLAHRVHERCRTLLEGLGVLVE
jgi:hypothetical protein